MGQFYSNRNREKETYSLPDTEVFWVDAGEWSYDNAGERCDTPSEDEPDASLTPCEAGWYYWYCFPGCLPDSEPNGPFETEEEAVANAREGLDYNDYEPCGYCGFDHAYEPAEARKWHDEHPGKKGGYE